jgi:hypothetical protein
VAEVVRLSGNLKVEWAVQPPSSSVATIPEDATAKAMSRVLITFA